MSLLTRLRKHWRAGIATIVATATLAGGMTAAFAGVGTGISDGHGKTIIGNGGVQYGWFYNESYGGLNDDTVRHFLDEKGIRRGGGSDALISNAVNQARDSIKARSGGQLKNPRIVGIAVMLWDKDGLEFNNSTKDGYLSVQDWKNAYHQTVDGNDFSSSSTHQIYRTSQRWSNGRSIDSFADEMMDHMNPHTTELMIIALNEDEPQIPYHVDVSTNAHPGKMYLRNNEPVYDTVHTRVTKGQWPAGNKLGATVLLNYEPGQGASAQPAKAVRHDFTINHVGDTNTPQL